MQDRDCPGKRVVEAVGKRVDAACLQRKDPARGGDVAIDVLRRRRRDPLCLAMGRAVVQLRVGIKHGAGAVVDRHGVRNFP